jgi:hypothetical protein
MFLLPRTAATVLAVLLPGPLAGCSGAGRFLLEAFRERPPAPLDSMSVASDARVDSMGYVVGSFVGEGTSRAVHLLSSDTGFIAALARRYRPGLGRDGDLWRALAQERVVTLAPAGRRRTTTGTPMVDRALVGGPAGHTAVTPTTILLHGSPCGPRGAQAEIIVQDDHQAQEPSLRGPVLGSFTHSRAPAPPADDPARFRRREPAPEPGMPLINELIARTARVMDSMLGSGLRSLSLRAADEPRLEINTLSDIDVADVMSFRPAAGTVRYAVSLRARRIAGGDTLLAATVMVWDSAGAWQQVIFRPTVVSLRRGRLAPYAAVRRAIFWRRLQPISDFAFVRDNLWMEQVDVRDGSVLWGIIQPKGNVVVAAAQVEGPCR